MTGSLTDAEDVVQDAWLRWVEVEGDIDSPPAYLTRIVTRLCLDRRRSARTRRETYVGPWLPDPLVGSMEPDETVADGLTVTLMLALERLSPLERAAFLLHDVFDVPLSEVAVTLDREPVAVRQLASRACKHVQAARPRFNIEPADAERITRGFFVAARDGDVAALSALLARNVEIHTDGGGKVLAFRNVIHGIERALRLFAGQRRKGSVLPTLLHVVTIDGLPGYVSLDRGGVLQTTALDIRGDGIAAVYIVKNPDKLSHVAVEGNFLCRISPMPPAC
jgi:RNA polymerase sigma-70 factor (ECF subfamily)